MTSSLGSKIGWTFWLASSIWNDCNAFFNHASGATTIPKAIKAISPLSFQTTHIFSSPSSDDRDREKMSSEDRDTFKRLTEEFLIENGKTSLLSGAFSGDGNDDNNNNNKNNKNAIAFEFPTAMPPKNPFAQSMNEKQQALKNSLYSDEELMAVLNIHGEVSDEMVSQVTYDDNDSFSDTIPSFHDLVVNAIQSDAIITSNIASEDDVNTKYLKYLQTDSTMSDKIKKIRAIASDVDGTILTSEQTIHPRTRRAIKKAIEISSSKSCNQGEGAEDGLQYFFPATGKSRKGALDSLGSEIGGLIAKENVPGVYLQGLFCVDGSGNVVFEKKLNRDAIAAAETLVAENEISVVAYDGDHLCTTQQTDIVVHLNEHYGEPLPQLLISESNGNIQSLSSHSKSFHKLLLMDNDTEKLEKIVRPRLEELASKFDACVTQALPTMLELLPKGCSKANGVAKLCEALSIDVQEELLAIGDAENDAEMLKTSCIGIAVGNATPKAKDVADIVLDETNEEGAAGLAIELFGLTNDMPL